MYAPEIDRVAALHQVDLMLHPTQDAGPFTAHTRLRDYRPCVDAGYFLVRAISQTGQSDHRATIMDPWGIVLGASQFHADNEPVVATLRLDNRPKYYEWARGNPPGRAVPGSVHVGKRPEARGDLRSVVLGRRRPELYRSRKQPR